MASNDSLLQLKVRPVSPNYIQSIVNPRTLYSREDILSTRSILPAASGMYGWFFKEIPGGINIEDCATQGDLTLLYVGISPDRVGKPNSKQTLRKRVTTHFNGNAEGSTLRRSLGVLLIDASGYPLRRVGSGRRITLTHLGEQWLDTWMDANAYVCWLEHPTPWDFEEVLLSQLSLPLNIKGNNHHPFSSVLSNSRRQALKLAREEPIALEINQTRQTLTK